MWCVCVCGGRARYIHYYAGLLRAVYTANSPRVTVKLETKRVSLVALVVSCPLCARAVIATSLSFAGARVRLASVNYYLLVITFSSLARAPRRSPTAPSASRYLCARLLAGPSRQSRVLRRRFEPLLYSLACHPHLGLLPTAFCTSPRHLSLVMRIYTRWRSRVCVASPTRRIGFQFRSANEPMSRYGLCHLISDVCKQAGKPLVPTPVRYLFPFIRVIVCEKIAGAG